VKSVHLAAEEDTDRVLALVAAFHAERGIDSDPEARREAVAPLLGGSQLGAVWLIGPRRAPVGYIAITFGWSIAAGGMTGRVDEFYIRPAVRGRGMGTEALLGLCKAMREAGLITLDLPVAEDETRLQGFARRCRFAPVPDRLILQHVL
jgi:GNAT superfamily N-acetyltransferase